MKSKKIIALALVAAMSISAASSTVFAASSWKWSKYEQSQDNAITYSANNTDYTLEGYIVNYKVGNGFGGWNVKEGKDGYIYRKGSAHTEGTKDVSNDYKPNGGTEDEPSTAGQKAFVVDKLNKDDITQIGAETAGLLFRNLKANGGFDTPNLEEEHDCVFVGYSLETTTFANAGAWNAGDSHPLWAASDVDLSTLKLLDDNDDIIEKIEKATLAADGTKGKDIEIYPVFREKTKAEKLASSVAIANRKKVAKPAGDKEWVYSQKDLDRNTAKVSAPLGESSSSSSLKKCNAQMKHSRVYEIKPAVDGKVVDLKSGTTEKVVIPLTGLYADREVDTNDEINALIKKGKIKVYHIGSDGKSRQVTGIKGAGDDSKAVEFKCGSFSEFVITKDPDARAQAGEEDGASGGNPATGEASALPVAMLALAALSATGVVAYKKRKAE